MPGAITTLGKLIIADDAAFSINPRRIDFTEFDPGVMLELRDMNGTRGKFDKDSARVRHNRTTVAPRLRTEPTSLEWVDVLKWSLGGTPTGGPTVTYPLGDGVFAKYVRFDPNQGKKWTCENVGVDGLTLSCSSGEPLAADLDLVGLTYQNPVSAFPSGNLDVSTKPFIMSDCVLTWNAGARQFRDISISVRNNLDRSRYLNSLTLTALQKLTRQITWAVELPSGDYDSLWDSGLSDASLSAVFTNESAVLTIASTSVRFPPRNPNHPFQNEGMLRLEGEAFSPDGTATPLTVTLNLNPGP